jgi:hypothetical protein
MALIRLIGTCDTVLMDLRDLSRDHRGWIFELHALINNVPLGARPVAH